MGRTLIPSLDRRDLIQTTCRLQSDKAIYSASVLDKATVFCARDCHANEAPASWKKYPVWDCQLILLEAQSESVNTIRPLFDAPSKTRLILGVVLRYAIMCFAARICFGEGLALNCAILVTAKEMLGLVPIMIYNRDPMTDWYSCQNASAVFSLCSSGS